MQHQHQLTERVSQPALFDALERTRRGENVELFDQMFWGLAVAGAYALKVVPKTEAPRFSFAKREDKKVSGVDTWEIRFQEERAPTLMHGLNGESLLSSGSLWIEPQSGRILKTEIRVENPYSNPPAKAEITVTYKASPSLGMLVPSEMEEKCTTKFTTVTAVAEYSDYRLFRVGLKSAIDPKASNP